MFNEIERCSSQAERETQFCRCMGPERLHSLSWSALNTCTYKLVLLSHLYRSQSLQPHQIQDKPVSLLTPPMGGGFPISLRQSIKSVFKALDKKPQMKLQLGIHHHQEISSHLILLLKRLLPGMLFLMFQGPDISL